MIELNKELKNNFSGPKKEVNLKKRRLNNKINSFLNSYFKLVVVIFVVVFFISLINYVIIPRFKKVAVSSEEVLQNKKAELLREYSFLQNYKKIIANFSQINEEDIYKTEKMIPARYSREDLFIEVTYFLLENNFKTDLVKISDPLDLAPSEQPDTQGRRKVASNVERPEYYDYIVALSPKIGTWLVEVELSEVDYPSLKQFLSIMENNLKLMDVYSLDFDPQTKTIKAKIITYYKK